MADETTKTEGAPNTEIPEAAPVTAAAASTPPETDPADSDHDRAKTSPRIPQPKALRRARRRGGLFRWLLAEDR